MARLLQHGWSLNEGDAEVRSGGTRDARRQEPQMHQIIKTLAQHSGALIHELTDEVGFTEGEATVFLREAAPDLIASYVWQSSRHTPERRASPTVAREVLGSMNGDRLAPRVGQSSTRTWAGLRALVPAVLRATSSEGERLD